MAGSESQTKHFRDIYNNQLLAFVWQSLHPTKVLNQKVKFVRKFCDPKGFS